jgi:L-asparaginase
MKQDRRKILILTTGGTIEKTYDELKGSLANWGSITEQKILPHLRLPHTDVSVDVIMCKDSLDMDEGDRQVVANSIATAMIHKAPIVVIHGTDTMEKTVKYCFEKIPHPAVPVIFTGAMLPPDFINSDAYQNLSESLLAAKMVSPGFYVVFHNEIFQVPNVRKNHVRGTFEQSE